VPPQQQQPYQNTQQTQQPYSQQPNVVVPNIVVNVDNHNSNSAVASANGGNLGAISPKSKDVALILAIFLGYLGVHRFYVGKIGMGLLYLFTGGLFGIGWIWDIIKIVSGNFRDSHGLPLVK
jgi:hypothetical protein